MDVFEEIFRVFRRRVAEDLPTDADGGERFGVTQHLVVEEHSELSDQVVGESVTYNQKLFVCLVDSSTADAGKIFLALKNETCIVLTDDPMPITNFRKHFCKVQINIKQNRIVIQENKISSNVQTRSRPICFRSVRKMFIRLIWCWSEF